MYNFNIYPQILVAIIANGGAFIFGISIGWAAPVGPQIINFNFPITTTQFGCVVSSLALGGAITCVISGVVRKRIGTRLTILIFSIPMELGWLCIIFASCAEMLMLGRFFIGLSIGCYCYVLPIYIGEISSNEIRGSLLSTFQVFLNVGVVFVFIVGYFVNLRVLNVICGILPVFYTISFLFLPESPGILISKGKYMKAKKSILILRGKNYNYDKEIHELQLEYADVIMKTKFLNHFKNTATFKAFVIIMIQFFFFQVTGINAVLFYTTSIFIESGIELEPAIATIIVGFVQVIGTVFATFLVDRLGRKILLGFSTTLMFLSLSGIGIFFTIKDSGESVEDLGWLPVISLSTFVIGFSTGMGPVSYVLLGELFSSSAKTAIAPIGQVLNSILTFIVGIIFPLLTQSIGIGPTFFIFATFAALAILFTIFIIPETKGKSFTEIQSILNRIK